MQSHSRQNADNTAVAALAIALEDPLLNSDPKVLCAAAQVCRAWRCTVQQCSVCNLDVELRPSTPVLQLCSFAAWLPSHAALVKSITVQTGTCRIDKFDGLSHQQYTTVAYQLLQPALRQARLLSAEAAAAAVAAAAAAAAASSSGCSKPAINNQQQPGLHLQRFCSNLPLSAGMLADLPDDSLTALDLDFQDSIGVDGSTLSALLARLSSLQQLRLSTHYSARIPGSCLAGVASLGQLTELILEGHWKHVEEPLRRLVVLNLPLPVMNMSALTSLQDFRVCSDLHKDSVLPAQLQRLQMHCCTSTRHFSALQQLRELSLDVEFDDRAQLLGLAQLPRLQRLALRYIYAYQAAESASAWQQLPQLQELSVEYEEDFPDQQQADAILAGVAACTQLTKLELEVGIIPEEPAAFDEDGEDDDPLPVAACASFVGLTRLRHLSFNQRSYMVPGDALALTALTALTHLDLNSGESAVDDVVANALACSLKQLCHLDLSFCQLGSMACMAAIGHLSGLTALKLDGVAGVTERGLMLLTRLSTLQCLDVTKRAEVTYEVLNKFWAAVRAQRH